MSIPFQEIVRREAEEAVGRAVRENLDMVFEAIKKGDFSGFFPNGVVPVQTPQEVRQDAKERSWRTLWQQLGIDVAVALATVVGPLLLSLDVSSKEQWTFIGLSVLKTIVSTLVAYVFRLLYAPREESQISLAEANRVA